MIHRWHPASAEGQPPRPPWPVQFSIRHLLVFVLAVSVLLALTTQLRHVGFTAFCFLAAAGIGKWRHKRWLAAASVTALLVFTITYLTCWVSLGYASVMNYSQFNWARSEFHKSTKHSRNTRRPRANSPSRCRHWPRCSSLPRRLARPGNHWIRGTIHSTIGGPAMILNSHLSAVMARSEGWDWTQTWTPMTTSTV